MVRHRSSEIRDLGKPSKILQNLMIVFAYFTYVLLHFFRTPKICQSLTEEGNFFALKPLISEEYSSEISNTAYILKN